MLSGTWLPLKVTCCDAGARSKNRPGVRMWRRGRPRGAAARDPLLLAANFLSPVTEIPDAHQLVYVRDRPET